VASLVLHSGVMEFVCAEGVVKRQNPQFTLGPIDFALSPGRVLGIVGDRGSGKSTLMRLIWGFLRPDQGTMSVFGWQAHLNQIAVRRRAGFLLQPPRSDGSMTARRYLDSGSRFYEDWDGATSDVLLERFGIDPGLRLDQLSAGAKVKLALISATCHRPTLLLLDDPMAGVGVVDREEISGFLKTLAENGTGMVVATRSVADLDRLSDATLILKEGKIEGNAPSPGPPACRLPGRPLPLGEGSRGKFGF
jgi:ABC-2 type transport system ATP-binding protein